MSWSSRRKAAYSGVFIAAMVLLIGVPLFLLFYEPPTCNDGKKNQGELGIDCSGPCPKICATEFLSPLVVWSRAIRVAPGLYNLLAYAENPNISGKAERVSYIFRLYDSNTVLIAERKGKTFILPHKKIPVFESGVKTGERVPVRVTFEFMGNIPWEKETESKDMIIVQSKVLNMEKASPRLDAVLENRSVREVEDIEVTAIVYDTEDNALAFSRTIVDEIGKNSTAPVTFTWPEKFARPTSRIEILPLVRP